MFRKTGYGKRCYRGKVWLAHRAAWDEQVGSIPSGKWILHHCDNRLCVRIKHLYIGDRTDNMRDMVQRGRSCDNRGEANPHRTLTEQQVAEIRRRYTGTKRGNPNFVSQTQLAIEYGVTQAHISKIVLDKNWN